MQTADQYRKLANEAKARARAVNQDAREVLMSVSDTYLLMARVQEELEYDGARYSQPR